MNSTLSIRVSGHELRSCINALAYVVACPFEKTRKPTLPLTDRELNGLLDRLLALWTPIVTSASTLEDAFRAQPRVTLERPELRALIETLVAVCEEMGNVPTDMDVIVGADTAQVHAMCQSFALAEQGLK